MEVGFDEDFGGEGGVLVVEDEDTGDALGVVDTAG